MNDDNPRQGDSTSNPSLWELRLYIAGQTPKSLAAIANLRRICDDHLAGRYLSLIHI